MICSAERERRAKAEDRCLAQRRKEVRKERALLKALRAGRAKPEEKMSRAKAPRRRERRKHKGMIKGAARGKGKIPEPVSRALVRSSEPTPVEWLG